MWQALRPDDRGAACGFAPAKPKKHSNLEQTMTRMAMPDEDDKKAATKTSATQSRGPSPARDERLAVALRENLRRRKAQLRDRRRATDSGESQAD
jgi:hypothetical protein